MLIPKLHNRAFSCLSISTLDKVSLRQKPRTEAHLYRQFPPPQPKTRKNREPHRRLHGFVMVGEGGLEPPRPEGHWHLKPARLPFRHSPECFWPLSDLFKIAHSRSIASNTLITAYFHPSSCAVYPPPPAHLPGYITSSPTPSASHPPITHPTLTEDATLSATLTFTLRISLTTLPPRLPLVSLLVGNSPRELSVWNLY